MKVTGLEHSKYTAQVFGSTSFKEVFTQGWPIFKTFTSLEPRILVQSPIYSNRAVKYTQY